MGEKNSNRSGNTKLMPAYGRKKILLFARAYRELAAVYQKNKGETSETYGNRQEFIYKRQLQASRTIMAGRLNEMADCMDRMAKESLSYLEPKQKCVKAVTAQLKRHGINLREILLLPKDEGVNVVLTMKGTRKADYTTEDIAELLTRELQLPLLSAKENMFFVTYEYDTYLFEPRPQYFVLTGIAKATKEGEETSGDNYSVYDTECRRVLGILSDGAGSGMEACKDSEQVLEWMEKYLETGFDIEEATGMVNSVFLAEGREQNMPTLDLCRIDLHLGRATFVKYGAADSYIKHDQSVERINNYGFPLGFCTEQENRIVKQQEYELEAGDMVIMLTDGVIECFEDENLFLELLEELKGRNPTEMSNFILKYAIHQCGGHIRDDMTVLSMGVFSHAPTI